MNKHIYPDPPRRPKSHHEVIQGALDDPNIDVIYLHTRDKKGHGTPQSFDIGNVPLLVKKQVKIIGWVDDPQDSKPYIKGTCAGLSYERVPHGPLGEKVTPRPNCGIFSVAPGSSCSVEIMNLHLEHTPEERTGSMHGSATIAYLPDNTVPSTLIVTDCEIDTSATGGIGIEGLNANVGTGPVKHDVIIRGCTITGSNRGSVPVTDPRAPGNYIAVRLGAILAEQLPVDMRDSVFEVSGCRLDTANYAAVAGGNFESNSNSVFVVSDNTMGRYPVSESETTPIGVIFFDLLGRAYPKGTITIALNRIDVKRYFISPFPDMSMGISVDVQGNTVDSVKTIIVDNVIRFLQDSPPTWSSVDDVSSLYFRGIHYRDTGTTGNAAAIIQNNTLESLKVNPLGGIWVVGNAHDVVVTGNYMKNLTASYAQIYIDKTAHGCVLALNSYGKLEPLAIPVTAATATRPRPPVASLVCDGDSNCLLDGNFNYASANPQGTVCIKLAGDSSNNLLVVDAENFPSVQEEQWWVPDPLQWKNLGTTTEPNHIVLLPKYSSSVRPLPGLEMFFQQLWFDRSKLPMFEPLNPLSLNVDVAPRGIVSLRELVWRQ